MNKTKRRQIQAKNRKEYEYEEAPSGFIWTFNAKEPLMKFQGGFGFDGVLALDGDDDKVQCHFCGEWFGALGHHLAREHAMTAKEYKEQTGLSATTALISEKSREKLVKHGMKRRLKNLSYKKVVSAQTKAKISATLGQNRMANKNRNGTCPEQLIDRLIRLRDRLGRTPRYHEVNFMESLKRTYGTYKEACRVAGIAHIPVGYHSTNPKNRRQNKYNQGDYIAFVEEFYIKYDVMPVLTDFKNAGKMDLYKYVNSKKWDRNTLHKQAMVKTGKYTHLNRASYAKSTKLPRRKRGRNGKLITPVNRLTVFRFTDRELLTFLKRFEDIHGRKPSSSDAKRNLVPSPATYANRFGSWKKAIKMAGVKE